MAEKPLDCLSFGDALFLHLERKGAPLHMASLCVFDGQVTLATLIAQIQSKLPLIPRYLQRVVPAPLEIGLPVWEYDPNFDIRNHVRELPLKRGTDTELQNVASHILGANLDRRYPLWDFTLITGLKQNRTALLARVHHCLADGVSGIQLLKKILDDHPTATPKKKLRMHIPAPPSRDPGTVVAEHLARALFLNVERVLKVQSEVAGFLHRFVAGNGNGEGPHASRIAGGNDPVSDGLNSLLAGIASPAQRLPFNRICHGPQSFAWTEIPFSEVRAIKRKWQTTVNDVVLALVTAAVRDYAERMDCSVRGRELRIVVPVSVRTNSESHDLGNRITFVPVSIPLDLRDPVKLLQLVHQRTCQIKSAHIAELISLAGTVLGLIPGPLQALVGPLASQLPLSLCNLICTNVPGPPAPLYLSQHKMIATYPYVPIGGEMGMNCAVLSYDGKMFFGFTGDVNAAADLKAIPQYLTKHFKAMRTTVRGRAVQAGMGKTARREEPSGLTKKSVRPSPSKESTNEPALSFAVGA